jgi:heme o synthase
VAFTVVPFALGWFGAVYLGAALGLGAVFLWLAVRLRRSIEPARASALFHYSLLYLALIFVAAAIDPLVI